ncbi:MAG: hypothetical protein ACK56F_16575, partial [bacterium]
GWPRLDVGSACRQWPATTERKMKISRKSEKGKWILGCKKFSWKWKRDWIGFSRIIGKLPEPACMELFSIIYFFRDKFLLVFFVDVFSWEWMRIDSLLNIRLDCFFDYLNSYL